MSRRRCFASKTQGQVLRGRFTGPTRAEEWCNRRVLARIHRLTIGPLRREIEPVTTAPYLTFLRRWQHVAPASRLHGIDGTLQIVRQLEGYEIPAFAWETQILPARIAGYRPEYLDRLCYAGDVMWGRLSPHPALEAGPPDQRARVRPTRLAPIALFLRANADELIVRREGDRAALSHAAREILARDRAIARAVLCRDRARHETAAERSRGGAVATRRRRFGYGRRLRCAALPERRKAPSRREGPARASALVERALDAAASRRPNASIAKRSRADCWRAGASSFATSSRARASRRGGASCSVVLRRMEARGEIRGGRFVAGFVGEQFALPEAVDALRAARRIGPNNEPITLGSYDPLNLAGIILPDAVA